MEESNYQVKRSFLEQLVQQVCQFYALCWLSNTLRELQEILSKESQWVLGESRRLLAELPPDGNWRLFDLMKQIPACRIGQAEVLSLLEQLRMLLIRLSKHWDSYQVIDWQPDVPRDNNGTEPVLGRMKNLS